MLPIALYCALLVCSVTKIYMLEYQSYEQFDFMKMVFKHSLPVESNILHSTML